MTEIAVSSLEPGDLIFWAGNTNTPPSSVNLGIALRQLTAAELTAESLTGSAVWVLPVQQTTVSNATFVPSDGQRGIGPVLSVTKAHKTVDDLAGAAGLPNPNA